MSFESDIGPALSDRRTRFFSVSGKIMCFEKIQNESLCVETRSAQRLMGGFLTTTWHLIT